MLLRLSLLDGRAFVTPGKVRLLQVVAVRDAAGLIAAGADPTNAELSRCLELRRAPLELSTRWLAAAQRDLKILRSNPTLLRAIEDSPRTFRRYGTIDIAWLDDRQRRIDEFGRAEQPARFGLVAAVKGNEVAQRLERWFSRSEDVSARRRTELRQRLAVLIAALKGKPQQAELLEETVAGIHDAARRPGRASTRTVRRLVVRYLAWPGTAHEVGDSESTVQAIGEEYIAKLPSTRTPGALSRLERALTMLALTCEVEDEGSLTQHEIGLVLRKLSGTPVPPKLTIRALLGVFALDLNTFRFQAAVDALGAGLSLETVTAIAKADLLGSVHEFKDDSKAFQLWARWTTEVTQALPNRKLELPTRLFVGRGSSAELRAFAEVLLNRGDEPPAALLDAFDTMLAISKRSPQALGSIRARLAQTNVGLGKRHAPEFTTWLGNDALIDRHFTLKALLGEPLEVSRTLRRDFAAGERLLGELSHLRARTTLTAAQRKRVELLEQRLSGDGLAGPEWTRRELQQRNVELEKRALELLFDEALRESLRAGWSITLTKGPLTAAWRDALRFMLVTRHNTSVLKQLLTHAAREPGAAITRRLPKNVEWIEQARAHFDVDAWLAPRTESITISGREYRLSTEQNPLEALRMGIPFDTCLSLTDGENAGAAVLNAVEANKRVLYLRTVDGTIVARKLIAVSPTWSLLGYRTYSALNGAEFEQVDAAFDRLCRAIAADAKLPLGNSGQPDKLHGGFWYDDGLVAFAGARSSSLTAFCASIGRPEFASRDLEQAAKAWTAREANDVDGALTALRRWTYDGETRGLADWVIERLGETEAVKRAPQVPLLADALLDRAARKGTRQLLAMFERVRVSSRSWEQTAALLDRSPDRGLAEQLVQTARAACGKTDRFDDHDIEHGTIWMLPSWLERESVATTFKVIERVEPVWRYVVDNAEECSSCVDGAVDRLVQIVEDQYAREPSPKVVIEALESSRSRHVLRLALALAARFPFPRGRNDQPPDVRGFTMFEGAPIGCPAALRALKSLPSRMPEFAKHPDLFAAVLRQGGTAQGFTCDEPPFEALGDLQMHAAPVLAEWDDLPVHQPGPWALAYHRRHQTRWRAQLRQSKTSDWDATVWRALLGETREPGARTNDVRSPQSPPLKRAQLDSAQRLVLRQLEGSFDGLHDLPSLCADAFVIVGVVRELRTAIEKGAIDRALHLVQSLEGTPLPHWRDWRAMTEQALDRNLPEPLVTAIAARWIPGCTWSAPELEPLLLRRLAELPSVRAMIVTTLARVDENRVVALVAQLEALGLTPALDTLLDDWLREWMRQDFERLADGSLFNLPGLVTRITRLAFETPGAALQLFLRRPEFREASEMIDLLLSRFEPSLLRELVLRESTEADDLACRRAWLLAAIG